MLPRPAALRTLTLPPISSTSWREIARPKTGSAVAARHAGLDLIERLEQQRNLVGGNADARVGNTKHDTDPVGGPGAPQTQRHAAFGSELDRVADQVHDNTAQLLLVAFDGAEVSGVAGGIEPQRNAFRRGVRLECLHRQLAHATEIHRRQVKRSALGVQLCVVEDLVQGLQQAIRRLTGHIHKGSTTLLRVRPLEQRKRTDDAVHRRPDLMAHVGKEGGLCAARLFCLVAGPLELSDATLPFATQEQLPLSQG